MKIIFLPVVIVELLKKSAVQKRNAQIQSRIQIVVAAAVDIERSIKQRLQHIIKKIFARRLTVLKNFPHEVGRAGAPVRISADTEPAFFLQEIQEDNLPQKFFGKLFGGEAVRLRFGFEIRIILKIFFDLIKFFGVLVKKIFGDTLNTESLFQIVKRDGRIIVKKREQLPISRRAGLVFTDKVGISFGGRDCDLSTFARNKFVIQPDERQSPLFRRRIGIKSDNRAVKVDFIFNQRLHKISLHGAGAFDRFIFLQVHGENGNIILPAERVKFLDVFGKILRRLMWYRGRNFQIGKKFP